MSEDARETSNEGSDKQTGPDFIARFRHDDAALVGARWWNESFEAFTASPGVDRRMLVAGAVVLLGVGAGVVGAIVASKSDDDEVSLAALDLQRREGWNAGHTNRVLVFPPTAVASASVIGTMITPYDFMHLYERLRPDPHLVPYAVPTLFQALSEPANATLLTVMKPVHTAAMDEAYARGIAVRELWSRPEAPSGTAVIIDLPGPEAVACAAGLADRFCPVFTFDNWPHPLGVVPSHLTLGACGYYLPRFDAAAPRRTAPAPPVFVLDANRLAPYRAEASEFDNRYVAPVPSAASLAGLGVKRVLYLRPDAAHLTELDDLNADFVAWEQAGIEVRAVALSDFSAPAAAAALATTGSPPAVAPTYYYGGHPHYHGLFWHNYGWIGGGTARTRQLAPATAPRPLSAAAAYKPTFRPTIFASRPLGGAAGIGRQKPSGFGRVSVRMSGGRVSSYGGIRRSGSFGRSRSSYSG